MESPIEPPFPPTPVARPARAVFRSLSEVLKTLLLAAIVFIGARTVVLPYEVEGASMNPNLHDRERVLVNRMAYFSFDVNQAINLLPGVDRDDSWTFHPFDGPERGDIVVLHPPFASSKPFIKRILGVPGDHISFRGGYIYVNGDKLDEPYIAGPITTCRATTAERNYCNLTVPDGMVYVLGDNRENSSDSRMFGLVDVDDIIGKAWFTNWPLDDFGFVPHYDY